MSDKTSLSDLARKAGLLSFRGPGGVVLYTVGDSDIERLLALHVAELCAGVEPVVVQRRYVGAGCLPYPQWINEEQEGSPASEAKNATNQGYETRILYPATTVAALQARVDELEKISDEYMSLIRHMDAGGDFYEFQMKVTEALWGKK